MASWIAPVEEPSKSCDHPANTSRVPPSVMYSLIFEPSCETDCRMMDRVASSCATCAAYKSCRGFWLDPIKAQDHCTAWQRICRRLNETTAAAANSQ